jgi:hypothetical protein
MRDPAVREGAAPVPRRAAGKATGERHHTLFVLERPGFLRPINIHRQPSEFINDRFWQTSEHLAINPSIDLSKLCIETPRTFITRCVI